MARIEREKDAAIRSQDRDAFAFNERMARLDRETADAKAMSRKLRTPQDSKAYLEDLPLLCDASGPEERKLPVGDVLERRAVGKSKMKRPCMRKALSLLWTDCE
ncbi:MAG: hypothetical protein M3R57_07820 [Chloroflexota bacterium]|nr:hypothetical protein [Chloroflexota bacterium]